jgi:hypothetical protein
MVVPKHRLEMPWNWVENPWRRAVILWSGPKIPWNRRENAWNHPKMPGNFPAVPWNFTKFPIVCAPAIRILQLIIRYLHKSGRFSGRAGQKYPCEGGGGDMA